MTQTIARVYGTPDVKMQSQSDAAPTTPITVEFSLADMKVKRGKTGDPDETLSALKVLKRKVEALKKERERIVEEYDERIEKLQGALEVLQSDVDLSREKVGGTDEYPSDSTLPDKIVHVLRDEKHIMKPRQIDSHVRDYEPDLRKNAVAETVSRMAKKDDGRLYRRKYGGNTHYYGLSEWRTEDGKDFKDEFKPEGELI